MNIFENIEQLEHEQIVYCYDKATSLKAIIGIHNTVLGPAFGGTRMWIYKSEKEALTDVLRLSRGMTYKSAISGLNLGGGKAVIIGDVKTMKNEHFLRKFGAFVQRLNGHYITAPDVNMNSSDMENIRKATKHVAGLPEAMGGKNPAPATAYGTYLGMKAAAKKKYGTESLKGKKIAIQGVGQVGMYLIEYLVKEEAQITITDIFPEKIEAATKQFDVRVSTEDQIYDLDMDIYAPCALGASLNDNVIPRLKCSIIAGSANNQLENEVHHSQMLADRDILYAPDFLINAGGIISVYYEHFEDKYNQEKAYQHVDKIYDICLNVFAKAEKEQITTHAAAMILAKQRISAAS